MNFVQRFTFLFSAPTFEAEDLEGMRVAEIIAAIQRMGFQVIRAPRIEDAEMAVQTDAAIGCLVVDWGKKGLEGKAASLINLMRRRGLEMPIVLLVRRKRFEDVPVEVLDFIDGYVFLAEETPEFIARNLVSRLTQYAETLKTPFFGALVDYAEEGNQLWTCPGHNGGVFYSRSPIGRIFMEHLGEAIFRDDLDNSITELGDLLTHVGPAHGALLLAGAIPVYLPTDRNAHGLIGPMEAAALDEAKIREAIRSNPLVTDKDAWQRERPFPPPSSSNAPMTARSTARRKSSCASGISAITFCSTKPGPAS